MKQLEQKRQLLRRAHRLVVKLGSSVLADSQGLKYERMKALVDQVAGLVTSRKQVVIVSSGAIAAGAVGLGLSRRPRTIPEKQAAAAVGQIRLMAAYESLFSQQGVRIAQVLLTGDDFSNRRRYLNAKHTMTTLLQQGIVPIVNENDTVVVAEIKFGDNDNLSALVATLIDADLLVILSDVAGLYTADPRGGDHPCLVPLVTELGETVLSYASPRAGAVGTGGMTSKLEAAATAAASGVPVLITDGQADDALGKALCPDHEVGTLILHGAERLKKRKHWIAYTLKPAGLLITDSGAREAVVTNGSSLLPSGIIEVKGRFEAGSCVSCADNSGTEFARGLVAYSSNELEKIMGLQSRDLTRVLGYKISDEAIHRDDLVVLKQMHPS